MKELILFRHAKSDWSDPGEADHERPLTQRGIEDSKLIGAFLSRGGWVPQRILTSSAVRARSTLEIAGRAGNWRSPIFVLDEFYESDAAGIEEILRAQDDEVKSLMAVGHNPTWEDLASDLIGGGSIKIPTASVVLVKLAVGSWGEVDRGVGSLSWAVTPKLMKKIGLSTRP